MYKLCQFVGHGNLPFKTQRPLVHNSAMKTKLNLNKMPEKCMGKICNNLLQGGEDSYDAWSCRSFFANLLRATNYRALSSLQKMTHEHEASYGSSPPCTVMPCEKTQVFVPAPRFEINLMLFVCASARESARAREGEKARARECASKRENVKENVSVCILTCLYVHNFIFV